MLTALEKLQAVIDESDGIIGWHLNGAVAEWNEFEFVGDVERAISEVKD
jgi:hypothetical protein